MSEIWDNLLPCPFCGATKPVCMMRRYGKDGWRDRYYVLCDYDIGGCGAASGWYHSLGEAAAAWNERVSDGQTRNDE